eukprot:2712357-Rhodomonas_salina.1
MSGLAKFAGELKVKVVKVEGFAEKSGFFVKITLGKEKQKTSTKNDAGGSATFNEELTFTKAAEDKVLHVEVLDSDTMSNDALGDVDVDLSATGNAWYETKHRGQASGKVFLAFEKGAPTPAPSSSRPPVSAAPPKAETPSVKGDLGPEIQSQKPKYRARARALAEEDGGRSGDEVREQSGGSGVGKRGNGVQKLGAGGDSGGLKKWGARGSRMKWGGLDLNALAQQKRALKLE